jgi:hypothetical protein
MWCIGKITPQYRQRMYNLLDLYAQPYNREEPVVCIDEKSKQLTTAVDAWQKHRNQQQKPINWPFTRQDADKKLGKHYVA